MHSVFLVARYYKVRTSSLIKDATVIPGNAHYAQGQHCSSPEQQQVYQQYPSEKSSSATITWKEYKA